MIIGIDATHTVTGGAQRHLISLLDSYLKNERKNIDIQKIYVWSTKITLDILPKSDKIIQSSSFFFNHGLLLKLFWQFFFQGFFAKKNKCNILLVTGGVFFTNFKPVVVISQNILPFYPSILKKNIFSFFFLKNFLLGRELKKSFIKAEGIIFLSNFSKNYILNYLNLKNLKKKSTVIPHCLSDATMKFFSKKKNNTNFGKTIKILFVSNFEIYKNHTDILLALNNLKKSYKIKLTCVGSMGSNINAFNILKKKVDPNNTWIKNLDFSAHNKILKLIKDTNIFFFSSYCESFSVTLLEGFASNRPMLISDYKLFKDILGNNAFFYKMNSSINLEKQLLNLFENYSKCLKKNIEGYKIVQKKYNSTLVSTLTLNFLRTVIKKTR
jgi:glycosyltransferase involved in cell wall biosynthesis